MPRPLFALDRRWQKRSSKAREKHGDRVYYDPDDDFEYEADPNAAKLTWHRIRYRTNEYQEIDSETGKPVAGSEGQWRPLK